LAAAQHHLSSELGTYSSSSSWALLLLLLLL
jgi:hypothetical protein